jgi:sec-independent protein translocase protein TatA
MGLDNPLHIAFLVVILLLVFGARRLPEIGRSLGSGMREFKQSITGEGAPTQQPALGAAPQQPVLETQAQPAPQPAQVAAASEQAAPKQDPPS